MGMVKENVIDTIVFIILAVFYITEAVVRFLLPVRYRTKNVSGDIVLITGGGGGLGRLLAERFAKLGCVVVVWDINKEAIDGTIQAVKSQGGVAYGYVCDITKREAVYKTAKEVEMNVGKVSILVNNAGIVSGKPLLETPDHMIQRTFDVNVISHFWTTKAFLPGMINSKKGHVVTIASMAGTVGMTKLVDYCASKFAALGFDESLRIELESHGHRNIHTTAICPYFIKSTGMFDGVDTSCYDGFLLLPRKDALIFYINGGMLPLAERGFKCLSRSTMKYLGYDYNNPTRILKLTYLVLKFPSLVPVLDASYVADKIIKAVITNQKQVYLPGFFKGLILLKGIMPWSVISMFLKALVRDAHPDHIINRHFISEEASESKNFRKDTSSILESTTENIPHIYRDISTSERKP